MSRNSELDSRHLLFLLKVAACFAGLLFGSLVLAPQASMQNEPPRPVVTNNAVVVDSNSGMIGNYRSTPEPPKSTVRGRVFYEDTGRAVKRTSIMLMGKNGGRELSGLTDNNGNFEIKNVIAGTYYAFVNAPGVVSPLAFADLTKTKDEGFDGAVEGFPQIIVNGINDTDVQIPARRGGAISGRVMYADGDPAIGVKVEIMRKVKEKFVSVLPNFSSLFSMMMGGGAGGFQTDDRGVYRFAGLPNGEYIVKVTENASHGDGKSRGYGFEGTLFGTSSLLTMFYPDVLTTEKAQMVSVVAGQEISEINIYIPDRDLYFVTGKIVNAADKSPINNAKLSLKRTGENTASFFDEISKRQQGSSSDEQGNWNFKELPKGTYTLVIEPPYAGSYQDDPEGYMNNPANLTGNVTRNVNAPPKPKLAKKTQEITIEDNNLSEIVIELGYGATISGTVVTENNQEMPTSVSIAAHNESEEADVSTTVYNGAEMNMEGKNPKPKKTNHVFKLEGVAEGKTEFKILINDENFYVKSAMFNGTDLLANPVELKEGEALRNVQIVVSKGTGTLKGVVSDDAKKPVKNVQFNLVPINAVKRKNTSFYRAVKTGENGEFELKAAPAEYAIIFDSDEYAAKKGDEFQRWLDEAVKNAVKVTIRANETETIALNVPK